MNKKNVLRLICLHTVFFTLGTILFVFLFHTPFFNTTIFFYRGIIFLFIATFIMSIAELYFRKTAFGSLFTFHDIILSVCLLFCLHLVFFTHVPVTADRSVSIFLLSYMNNHPENSFTKEEMKYIFMNRYVEEHDNIGKRYDEQIASGNIMRVENEYRLTNQGKSIMKFYQIIADLFLIDTKNLAP